jgi:hypothetical protein
VPTRKVLYLIIAPEFRYTFSEFIYRQELCNLSENVFAGIHRSKYPKNLKSAEIVLTQKTAEMLIQQYFQRTKIFMFRTALMSDE